MKPVATATPLLIYGATGYTGRLIVREAVARGLRPILAGRNASAVAALAAGVGLESRAAPVDDAGQLDRVLDGCGAVLNCAGPFSHTYRAVTDACIRNRVHYLDVTGEISVFESIALRSAEAASAGVVLLPGVGFDVVPSDCLAAHLHRRLPTATSLVLAFDGGTGVSPGTASTIAENIGRGGAIRRDGRITPVPAAWRERDIDFGDRVRHAMSIPWGDVSTAFHSTGIPNIEVYTAASRSAVRRMRLVRLFGPVLATRPAQALLQRRIRARVTGPSDDQRRTVRAALWGEASDPAGHVVRARLATPDGYSLTSMTAVRAAERVLSGAVAPGFQTPSRALGIDFILELPAVERHDLPDSAVAAR